MDATGADTALPFRNTVNYKVEAQNKICTLSNGEYGSFNLEFSGEILGVTEITGFTSTGNGFYPRGNCCKISGNKVTIETFASYTNGGFYQSANISVSALIKSS